MDELVISRGKGFRLNTPWLRCEVLKGPRQAQRLSEVKEVAQELCGGDGHVSVEIAPGRVFCDIYYWGPKSLFYLTTALYMATGEQFWHHGTFRTSLKQSSQSEGEHAV